MSLSSSTATVEKASGNNSSPSAAPMTGPPGPTQPLSGIKLFLILTSVLFAIFLVGLDRIILSVALPAVTDEFDSIQDIGWYGSAYMLTTSIFLPALGRVYKLYSTKWIFLCSVTIFEIGSAICGAAPNSASFIIGRAIAGIGSAGVFNGGMNIIVQTVPLHKRPVFTACFGIFTAVASIVAPLLGGAFTDNKALTWRWCFYLNLPIGGFTILAIFFFLDLKAPPKPKRTAFETLKGLDPIGAFFLAPSMVCLILALQWGGTSDSWSAPRIIGLLVTFAVTFVAFIVVECLTPETAMLPTRVILNRSVAGAMWYMFLFSGAMSIGIYYLAIWFQAAQGQSAHEAGIRTIPILISYVVFGILTGISTQKLGYYNPSLLLGPILLGVAGGLLSTLSPTSSKGAWIGYSVIYGFGIGASFQTATLVPQAVLQKADIPLGMAAVFFMKELGGAIFFSVAQNVFSARLVKILSGVAGLNPQVILNTGATDLRRIVPAAQLAEVVNAYSYSLTRTFLMAGILGAACILCAIPVSWTSIKKDKKDAVAVAQKSEGEVNKAEV